MEKHIVKVLKTDFLTHNVKRFVVEKPAGYQFTSGQATDVSINQPGLAYELRPFTFTCINGGDELEFTVKIYEVTDGITAKLLDVRVGDELILHEVFGAIHYKGPGLFIAGGTGITPFISIFRQLKIDGKLDGNFLVFANKTENDIILKDELEEMFGENHVNILSNPIANAPGKFINKELLQHYVDKNLEYYYVCGPERLIASMVENLLELGVTKDRIVIEE